MLLILPPTSVSAGECYREYDAAPDAPRTMRIDYLVSFTDFESEWVCPEHTGYARRKFEKWWRERSGLPPPGTAQECVEIARSGALREPVAITVRSVAGQRFPEIVKYTFPELSEADDEGALRKFEESLPASVPEAEYEDVPF